METKTIMYEFFQTDGYDETLSQAKQKWETENPTRRVVTMTFVSAYPGRPGLGRWVELRVDHEAKS